jgi:hypothetical protein
MKKWNLLLVLLIAGVLIAPGAVVAQVLDACCGVNVTDLAVADEPDPACLGDTVTISGTYIVYSDWTGWPQVTPYDTGANITIFDSDLNVVAQYEQILGEEQPDPGAYPPGTEWDFSQDWTPTAAGDYTYTVMVWAASTWGRMEISAVGQPITVEVCNEPPVAVCQDITLPLDALGQATLKPSQVNGGSYDPDGDPITLSVDKMRFSCADVGPNVVTLTVSDGEFTDSCEATVTVVDAMPPIVRCVETVNPHGKNVPGGKALGKGQGVNPDGFYQLFARDNCGEVRLLVSCVGCRGVYPDILPFVLESGVKVKFTEAPGATPSIKKMGSDKGQAGEVKWHITLPSEPVVVAVDAAGNVSRFLCFVPPPPK